ncbi:DUF1566 domain-containing protein [Pseudoalteromonas sp. JC28]|uniref:Lcl domain-containing protein n=1 Tax=Pseudoalteromonas sp. JC28 TaxID=2267617 RepID=UPI001C2D65EB|nr:DUF1566 domain-containing protein [Pseudoalteromonas sp. JC28]
MRLAHWLSRNLWCQYYNVIGCYLGGYTQPTQVARLIVAWSSSPNANNNNNAWNVNFNNGNDNNNNKNNNKHVRLVRAGK